LYALYGGTEPQRRGARHATIAPYGAFTTSDRRQLLVAVQNAREWHRFCTLFLGMPGLEIDERFVTNSDRIAHSDELDDIVANRFAQLSQRQALEIREDADIATAEINDMTHLSVHPQLVQRGRWQEVASPVGTLRTLLPPGIPAGIEPRLDPIPALGEHSEAILSELGYTPEEIQELRSTGAV